MLPLQCRMARAALEIGVRDLAELAKVSTEMITRFENGDELKQDTVDALRSALESAGITFLDGTYSGTGGPGVRLTAPVGVPVDADDTEVVQYPEYKNKGGVGGSGG